MSNYPTIYREFMMRGIPQHDIDPRVNVLTYRAWQAAGRQVRKGEHGVKVVTWISATAPNPDDTELRYEDGTPVTVRKRPWTATVFHVSQTDPT